jgi:transposase
MSDIEEWRPVAAFPDHYEVSSLGRVRSLPRSPAWTTRVYGGRILRQTLAGIGYPSVAISVDNEKTRRLVHLLVLTSFVGPALGRVCNHKDGVKTNNRLENLEWITQRENLRHSVEILGNKLGRQRSISDAQVEQAIKLRSEGFQINEIAEMFGVQPHIVAKATMGCGHINMPKGMGHKSSKLTDDDIRAIRRLRTTGLAQEKIASRFGVGQSTISSILRGETWGHVK